MRIGSLFSGIGGLELGLERAGLGNTVFQCEIDPFCQKVLKKHWPQTRIYEDIRDPEIMKEDCDLLCGGFPCQDLSVAGKQSGLKGKQSGLWYSFLNVIWSIKPNIVVVENFESGKNLWLPFVRMDLRLSGYLSRAYLLSASECGAPHQRKRVFVVAYSDSSHYERNRGTIGTQKKFPRTWNYNENWTARYSDQDIKSALRVNDETSELHEFSENSWAGKAKGRVCRMDDGISHRMDRLRSLGNAVVPQCSEAIGRIIMEQIKEN